MEIFKIWAIFGFIFLFLELAAPSMFFLPLGGAAFFSAIVAFKFPDNHWAQAIAFAVFAVIFFLATRPFMKKKPTQAEQTGLEAKYIGNVASVIKDIAVPNTDGIGTIKIYGETWQAKSLHADEIKVGQMVKIIKNESLIMFVEKINKE